MKFISKELQDYEPCLTAMEGTVARIKDGEDSDQIWLLEHPSLYTAGTSANAQDLLSAQFPVFETGRGGEYTYHGPGQRVAYVMMDLKMQMQTPDIKKYIWMLEEWIIRTLNEFDIKGERRAGRVGIWVVMPNGSESKIAAIGVRIRHWITFHGVSINVNPDLSHFDGIVPCGISGHGVTSMHDLGINITMDELDMALKKNFDYGLLS
jgi:lipoyl(octanoyl) transferase